MRQRRAVFVAAVAAAAALGIAGAAGPAGAAPRDYGQITCGAFLTTGQANIGYILWWLRGYHAGRRGVPLFDPADAYAARLGYYCRNHPRAKLLDASEHILAQLDRGR